MPRSEFLAEVDKERRRAERSRAPLSVVLYRVRREFATDPRYIERLLQILCKSKREADLLGHIDSDSIAVLCVDTDEAGAQGFVAKHEALCAELPVEVFSATYPDHLFESLAKGLPDRVALEPFLCPPHTTDSAGDYAGKRTLDVVGALLALVLLSPVMLAVMAAVWLTSPGPAIFKQPRVGKGGRQFTFYKFRSMVANSDDRIHREYVEKLINARPGEVPLEGDAPAYYKLKADPRVTRVGRFIRTTSLDELPQLFNVLKGDMSLVGPRPPIPYEAIHYEPWHLRRILTSKPGITGIWQVEGRSRVSFSEMVRMDLRYIRECSLALDLKLMLKTVLVVARCDGAS